MCYDPFDSLADVLDDMIMNDIKEIGALIRPWWWLFVVLSPLFDALLGVYCSCWIGVCGVKPGESLEQIPGDCAILIASNMSARSCCTIDPVSSNIQMMDFQEHRIAHALRIHYPFIAHAFL